VRINDGVFVIEAIDHMSAKGLQYLCRHLVGLCVTYRHKTEEDTQLPPRFAACSGTLLFVEGALYFLTAGHVLRELKELRDNDQVVIDHASLADIFGLKAISGMAIPFSLQSAMLCFVDDDELGLDFGVIPLGAHHARLLSKNGVIALSEENWSKQRDVSFDGYVMLGLPAELTSERVSNSSTVIVQPTCFALRRLDQAPDQRSTRYPQFIGQVSEELALKSLKGMSGGVIIGFRTQPALAYWVVAIQSSWNRETKITYGCSLPVLASLMTHWAKENIAVLQELDANTAAICLATPNAALPPELFT
jgi:hypothetical protein